MSDNFGQCNIVHFEEDKGCAYIGMIDVQIGTGIYECAVCKGNLLPKIYYVVTFD